MVDRTKSLDIRQPKQLLEYNLEVFTTLEGIDW